MTDIKSNTLEHFKSLHQDYFSPDNIDRYVFKKCIDVSSEPKDYTRKWLVILQKTSNTKTNESRKVIDTKYAKYRGSEFIVIKIININDPTQTKRNIVNVFDNVQLKYEVGMIVRVDSYDMNLERVCSSGIHCFKTLEPAYFYEDIPEKFTGTYFVYDDNGVKYEECDFINGKINGKYNEWHENGIKYIECEYTNGELNGKYNSWYYNGKKSRECEYVNGKLNGKCNRWDTNGQLRQYEYVNGELLE